MVITYYGVYCFKVQSGDMILAFDPPSKKSSFKAPRFQADIVFVSHDHIDHNGHENISSKDKETEPFLINSPGEYEIRGMYVRGIRNSHLNTIYLLNLENTTICHLGGFEGKELDATVQESLVDVDVLFVPALEKASKIINQIEPKVIMPMYTDKKKLSSFLKEVGQEKIKPIEKFTFKKRDIIDKKGEVIILS